MKINHNMSAIVANKKLLRTENSLSNSIEKLSTGLRINRASDDAAGRRRSKDWARHPGIPRTGFLC